MARKERKKAIVFALETSYGVDAVAESIAAANAGATPTPNPAPGGVVTPAPVKRSLLGREFSLTPMAGESQSLAYDDGTLGNKPEIATEIYSTMEFTVDLAAAGAPGTAAPWGELLSACLFTTSLFTATTAPDSVTYTINEAGTVSATFYFYKDGALHKMTGARGSFSMSAQAKQFGGIKFTFTGLVQPVTSAALPVPDFSGWQTPLKIGAANSAFTLGGQALKMISLEYDQANAVVYQEYVGHEEVIITDYQPTSTLVLEAPALAAWDPFALAEAGTELPLVFTNGSVGGKQVEFNATVQLGRPTYGDQDGTQTYSIPIRPLRTSPMFTTR